MGVGGASAAGVEVIQIPLTRGLVAVVDDEDAHLAALSWSAVQGRTANSPYAATTDKATRKTVLLHRAVMGFGPGDPMIDHKDGDGLNCRRGNLRASNQVQNQRNRSGARKDNQTTGVLGVYRVVGPNPFVAKIRHQGKLVHLGRHQTIEAATSARLAAERDLWGIEPRRAQAHG